MLSASECVCLCVLGADVRSAGCSGVSRPCGTEELFCDPALVDGGLGGEGCWTPRLCGVLIYTGLSGTLLSLWGTPSVQQLMVGDMKLMRKIRLIK